MRVIAGYAKGREIAAPKGLDTRPTLAKVKEAMFGMIQFDVEGAIVLDLFAGSGGLGIEALSRGAKKAVFCDADRKAVSVIRDNLKKLGMTQDAEVIQGDALKILPTLSGRSFDIVLLDPPYKTDLESNAIQLLDGLGLLSDNAIVLCEHSKDNPPVFTANYYPREGRKYGDSYLTYAVYSRKAEQ